MKTAQSKLSTFPFPSKRALVAIFLSCLVSWSSAAKSEAGLAEKQRPNILLILADDLGFSDIAPYGSEISTPNLSALAASGLKFSNYHTAPSCAPTRAMLLTGVDSHRAGVANIAEALTPDQAHSPFYRGSLNSNVVTIASLLKDAGYHTNLAGKWHLGYKEDSLKPINRGFEQTVMMPFSGADNWSDKSYLANYEKALWFENGQALELPEDFYSSKFLVDKAIAQIDAYRGDGKPFFSYVAFQAVHIPVQAPREYTEKYIETYAQGWDALRHQRMKAAKALGMIPADAPMKRMDSTDSWDALSPEEKRYNAKRMAVYAGMVDAMDFHIGRLITHLKKIGEYDNTVIVFTSDNGPEPSDPTSMSKFFPVFMKFMGYNNDYETLGEANSYNTIGTSFASAAASPLGHYKFHSGEGGMRVPLIISGPGLAAEAQGKTSAAMAFVKDLPLTLLELAGTEHPGTTYQGKTVEAATGKNLNPILKGEADAVYNKDDSIGYEIGGNAALIKGDYKILLNRGSGNDGVWHLYNIALDPGETLELEETEPAIFADLMQEYEGYTQENGVIPVPDSYEQVVQVLRNGLSARFLTVNTAFYAVLAVLAVSGVVRLLRRRKR
jgi:arylsulfatase A-like enzyme